MDAEILIKNCFLHNWKETKEITFEGVAHKNIKTVQIGLTHLFLLSSFIASDDLIGLNWYMCGDLTDFLVEQDCHPLVVLKMSNGIVWVGNGVDAITFSLFSICFTVSIKSSSLTSDTMGFVAIYFAQREHCTCIGKALKIHLKLILFTTTEPLSDEKVRDQNEPITGQHFSHMTITLQRRRLWQENPAKTTK